MKKRILTMAAALLTALTCVCACGGGETSQSQNSGNSAAEYDLEYAMAITSLEAGNEISPLIYGEFLEHIPGCVYGVIWAEMLEDRKFYYPAGEEGLSPWKTKGGVTSDSECYSLNGYAAVLEKGGEISQEVVFSKKAYAGYFYASGDGKIEADIGGVKKEFEIEGEFKKYAFEADSAAEGKRKVSFSCTQGNVKLDSFSLMPADNYRGMRRDTLDAMKALAGTIYRWPGGNFVSGYCWKDGIGDRDKRASLRNQAWFPETGNIEDDKKRLESGFYGRIEPNDMGTDEFMGVRPLGFHPVPGEWYRVKVEVCGNRIRIFLNDEKQPHIDLVDKNADLVPSGEVALGGGWIETEFDDLTVTPMADDALKNVKVAEYQKKATPTEKENKRRQERASYTSAKLAALTGSRTDITLDGNWLFMPDYQLDNKDKAVSVQTNDQDWHIMSVPNFWTPIRIWLHGETMPSPTGAQPKGVSDTYYQQETDRCENYTFDYRRVKYAWYRQWLELPANVEGKNMTLTFDAVSKIAEIYINGTLATSHLGMFGEIQVDGSRLLKPGKNLITVKVTRKMDGSASESANAIDFFYGQVC